MLLVDLGGRLCFLRELRSSLALRAPPQDSSCIAERMNRASSRDKVGTSVFLSISDLDCRVSAELEQESQASSCDEVGTLLDSTVVHGMTGPCRVVFGTCGCFWTMQLGCQCPFLL